MNDAYNIRLYEHERKHLFSYEITGGGCAAAGQKIYARQNGSASASSGRRWLEVSAARSITLDANMLTNLKTTTRIEKSTF